MSKGIRQRQAPPLIPAHRITPAKKMSGSNNSLEYSPLVRVKQPILVSNRKLSDLSLDGHLTTQPVISASFAAKLS